MIAVWLFLGASLGCALLALVYACCRVGGDADRREERRVRYYRRTDLWV